MGKINRWKKRGICLTLAASMFMMTGAEGLAMTGQPACDEAMYVTLDPYGTVKEASVVKHYTMNGSGKIVDYGTYGEIHNMTDTTVPVVEGDRVTFELAQEPEHGRFYFEGTLDPEKAGEELPWNLSVTYRLNGVEKNLEELAHEKGLVEILIDAVPNEKASDYYKNNMTLEATAIVNMDENLSVEAEGAQVQSMGNMKVVLFMALPGEEQHFRLRIGSDDFSFSGMMFLMVPVTLGQLDRLEDLREARDTVKDSADAISDSLDVILDSLDGMEDSLAATVAGLGQLDKSRQIIHNSKDSVYVDADQALAVLKELSERGVPFTGYMQDAQDALWDTHRDMNGLMDTVTGLDVDLEDINESLRDVKGDLADVSAMVSKSENNLEEWENKVAKLKEDVEKLKAYQKQSQETFEKMKAFLESLKKSVGNMDEYEDVLGITEEEFQEMKDSIEELLGMELPDGSEAAEEIQYTVASFSNAIKDTVSRLPDGGISETELKQMIAKLEQLLGTAGKPALMDKMIEQAEQTIAAMEQVIALAKTQEKSVQEILNDSVDLVGALRSSTVTGRDMLEEVDDLRGTMNRYHNTALNAAEDAGLLIESAVKGTDALYTLMNDVEGNLKAAGNPLNEGTKVTIDGLSQALNQAIDGLSRIGVIRDAKTTVTDLLDEKWEEYTGEDMTVLNADVNAKKISFTSARNQEPESLQIILRTEGTEEVEEVEAEIDEAYHAEGSFLDRIWSIFKRIVDSVMGLFS